MSDRRITELDRNRTYAGRFLLRLDTVESTNSFCLENTSVLKTAGLVVMADRQTRGRGSRGRIWEAGSGKNLFASFVIHPDLDKALIPAMTLLTGLSVFNALESLGALNLSIKWPNDIRIGNRKVSGILCESRISRDLMAVVAGVGINVSGNSSQFPGELRAKATTLQEQGLKVSRQELVQRISQGLDRLLLAAGEAGSLKAIFRQWERASSSIGRQVVFKAEKEQETGVVKGLDPKGGLVVQKTDGSLVSISSGTISYSSSHF